jgi:uncharacterized radical SAM superfamily protein
MPAKPLYTRINCKHCGAHVTTHEYSTTWTTLMARGVPRDELKAISPACLNCAGQRLPGKDSSHGR